MGQVSYFLLVVTLPTLVLLFASSTAENSVGFRAELGHVDAGKGYSLAERILWSGARSRSRAATLVHHGGGSFGPAVIHPSDNEFIFELAIGTPPVHITGILDTGSDLIWTQCQPLIRAVDQPLPFYFPFRSSTFKSLPCSHKVCRALGEDGRTACMPGGCFFEYGYGDQTQGIGYMGTETFTFGTGAKRADVPGIAFGCGLFNSGSLNNASAIVGFGRKSISLVNQVGAGTFSYCFAYYFIDNAARGTLLVGSRAVITGSNVRKTPMINFGTYYYLSLKGITVGKKLVPIPKEVFQINKQSGRGGFIIDSGTAFTQLLPAAYAPFVEAFRRAIKLPAANSSDLPFDLCYKAEMAALAAAMPRLVFHLEGADWEFPRRNYAGDVGGGVSCVLVQEMDGAVSIMGNVMTMDTQVLYDVKGMVLSFAPAKCSQL